MRLVKLVLSFAAVVAIGCGGSASTGKTTPSGNNTPTSTQPAADQPPLPPGEQLMVMFEQLATEVGGAGTDCNNYAQSVQRWTTANQARYKQLAGQVRAMTPSRDQARNMKGRLAAAMGRVVEGYKQCQANARAKAAFTGFDALVGNN